MALYVIALIICLPLIEIAVFIQAGSVIGAVPTILLTVLTAFAGTVMLRQQGLSLVMRMQRDINAGKRPEEDIMNGALIVVAAVFLLIPGFVTDTIGLLLFLPPVRGQLARFILSRANVTVTTPRRDDFVDLDEDEWSRTDGSGDGSHEGAQRQIDQKSDRR
ncbi:MAG: FxsA family protein [Rhodobacteraceae bacterium]|nr:FxsA family protein [Paracoccaceae bacterium]